MAALAMEFTPAEASALTDVPRRRIHRELSEGVIPTAREGAILPFEALVYLRVLRATDQRLPVRFRAAMFAALQATLGRKDADEWVAVDNVFRLNVGTAHREMRELAERFSAWKAARVESKKDVLQGEEVFRGTRMSVRFVGGMLLEGESIESVREGYPDLTDDDLAFAPLFAKAHARMGRPTER